MLKTGPAKHAVMAMSLNPFRAMVKFAERSPIEFPTASTVAPINVAGMPQSTPVNVNTSTRISAMRSIQVAAIMNP
eukprot:CAMPEP_0195320356 /NCGR_PEP_ID=MMETSP0708-20121125/6021_1 /TAXON_ID=33640 /ORGANISM="Asterionellopsis glacialis, Strain CCMP134" /LENGTH=75 /DNA_ID=CAMNT_0040386683 /DNA_START=221 /DNA_END=448 /DNA_ORIENTATION=-